MTAEILLDVSELEAPEPLQKVLGVLEDMGGSDYLRVIHRRDAHCLRELVYRLGFACEIKRCNGAHYEIFIWHESSNLAALAVRKALDHVDEG